MGNKVNECSTSLFLLLHGLSLAQNASPIYNIELSCMSLDLLPAGIDSIGLVGSLDMDIR
jgi:hypothetical protein